MSKPDALALADQIEPDEEGPGVVLQIYLAQAAAELRRLHNALRVAEETAERCKEACNATAAHWREDTMRLEAENEALRKDAARYRWLAEFKEWPDDVAAALDCGSKVMVDAAIDEAMKGQTNG